MARTSSTAPWTGACSARPASSDTIAARHLGEHASVLCEVTSVYLEGSKCSLARCGYSRDGKRGKLQIVFALPCNREGCPVAAEVFEGNTRRSQHAGLVGAMELRPERLEPGESFDERAYGALDAWLRAALDRVSSLYDVVRFKQLERHPAEAGSPDAARQLTGLFEYACYIAWLNAAFREQEALAQFDGATHGGAHRPLSRTGHGAVPPQTGRSSPSATGSSFRAPTAAASPN